jgi:prepilin-type N-terminal cleavage/methylation domain-containing protein
MIRVSDGLKSHQFGFTLWELLVAMSIGVAVVMCTALNTASMFRHQAVNSNATIALQLAQDKIEELQARQNPPNENRCPGAGDIGLSAGGLSGGRFDRCWRIQPSSLGNNLKQIDVTVSWRDLEPTEVTLSVLVFVGL